MEKEEWTNRTENLIGKEALEKLKKAKVAVYGCGGVGSFVVEGLVRAGIGNIMIVDNDKIELTNLNRQIHTTTKNIGMKKAEAMKQRALDINPNIEINDYFKVEEEEKLIDNSFSYIVDAVDTVETKIKLIKRANELNIPILSCMGTGNKLDPSMFEIANIEKTSVCPLARRIRKELKKEGITKVKVLYSKEKQIETKNRKALGTISFVPSIAGLMISGQVIKDIINK